MVKAAALFYSIGISLVIALITGSAILLSGLSTGIFIQVLRGQELGLNAESGLQLLLSDQNIVTENDEKIIDLYGDGNDSVLLSRKYWGAFEILVSRSFRNGDEQQRIAEAGFVPDSSKSYCLYVADLDRPVAVCGNTELHGNVYLPKAGIKRAYIEGQNYTGSSLVYGSIRQSEKNLPAFNKKLIETICQLRSATSDTPEMTVSSKNSFLSPAGIITYSTSMIIKDTLIGHIAIISNSLVEIAQDAVLKDIIICAPRVIVRKGFRGNLQIFASDSIGLEENVTFTYPSVLAIVYSSSPKSRPTIMTSENDTIQGCVFSCATEQATSTNISYIKISGESQVHGTIYTDGFADISGKISGSVMCRSLILQTNSSVYENHLLNAIINRNDLSPHFTGINLLEESKYKDVVKWLE